MIKRDFSRRLFRCLGVLGLTLALAFVWQMGSLAADGSAENGIPQITLPEVSTKATEEGTSTGDGTTPASSTLTPVEAAKFSIFDQADLLSPEEEARLTEQGAAMIAANSDVPIALITTDFAEGKITRDYGDDFFEARDLGYGPDYNGLYLLIDMDNRQYYIGTFGKAIRVLTDARIEVVLDEMQPYMRSGDYASAFAGGLEVVSEFQRQGIPSDQENVPEETEPITPEEKRVEPLSLLASAGGFGMAGLASGLGYRKKVKDEYDRFARRPAYDHGKEATADYTVISDNIISKNVVHVFSPLPKNTGGMGGGHSTTHTTGGGHSSGGGGRGF